MSTTRERKQGKEKTSMESKALSLQEKKDLLNKEEEVLQKEIEELATWTDMIDGMNDEQLKEYLQNRPDKLKTVKVQKSKARTKVQRVGRPKLSKTNGIMASVLKFHTQDDDK
ncbi:hypothetical protein HS088_TW06G00098 [Tripterygium wilfordii]|uniref:Uncharacterized protein n=1 Tax=Tripterygium wilfordii TaxID=458696 RepID=A0A7J7DI02_TRIWF|nr:hypothetical protein HS088_TW06G00098 [Tripterygium wilfordii]